uniref:BZIP domain-containing protein n=1 Tax=Moniliophthora roreri TaxID=221103 RepID=A0A0W0FCJ1_MONRR
MAEDKDSSERGYSKDPDTDAESHEDSNPPGKPGRKKNPNSQAARRDQNRIAQREFRLRKQQRIRDLEARVEILSGGKDEALGEMRNILKGVYLTLRNLLRSLAGFIGDGAGGLLPKLGWEMSDFNNFINRSETDTAWEGYQRRKKATASAEVLLNSGQKRSAEDESTNASKKPRTSDASDTTYPMLLPLNHQSPPNPLYSSRSHDSSSGMFPDMLRNGTSSSSPMFMQSGSSNTPPSYGPQASNASGPYQSSYLPSGPMGIDNALPPLNFPPSSSSVSNSRPTEQSSPEQLEDDDDPNKNEAYKLIHYHLDNFKRNSAYCLPSSLRPTLVQRTVPHESVIDRILHPELRDRMILLRTRFDLVDCLLDYRNNVTIHGDDVLAHNNWEIGEKWLRKYSFLVEPATLNIMNRWRRERGEPELRLSDLTGSEHTPGSA